MSAPEVTLYALPHSYYSGKTRAYLRYKRIPYREVLSTLRVFHSFIIPRTGVKFIPVIQTDDEVVIQDSTETIDFLEQRYPDHGVYPATPRQRLVSMLLELYGDEWLIIPGMHYRWSFWHEREHINEVLENFGLLLSPRAPRFIRRLAGKRFCQPFNGALPMLGVTPRSIPAVEQAYERLLDQLNAHFAQHDYLLGGRASIGDFGLIGPLYAHLGRDLYPLALMKRRAPKVYEWVQRMNSEQPRYGAFLPNDEIPETLLPVLRDVFSAQFPVLRDTVARLDAWIEANPARQKLPRVIGKHRFVLEGVEEERGIFPYVQWMLQRILDDYRSLDAGERASVDALLARVGAPDALQIEIRHRVKRERNRLWVET